MNPTAAFPVHTLTRDQAEAELEQLCDERFLVEDNPIEFARWKKDKAQRVTELEVWIMTQSPRLAAMVPSEPETQDAPPHHLQPEPPKASAAPKEKPVSARKTPKEKMQSLVDAYHTLVEKIQVDPTIKRIRDDASTCKTRMRMLEREFHITAPELRPIPPLPARAWRSSPAAVAEVLDRFLPTVPEAPSPCGEECVHPDHHHAALRAPKAGPGPYQEPTAKEIRDLLPNRGPSLEVQVQLHPDLAAHLNQVLEDARTMLPAWVRPVVEELARARAKFPSANHRTLALAEEAGEVVKAVLDLRAGKGTLAELHTEIYQTMAMCVRLLEEGDPAVLPVVPAEKVG